MTGFTTFENFPYPQGTDPFRVQIDDTGFPQQSRDLALAVQAKIDAAPGFIKHRPFFRMTMNTSQTFTVSVSANGQIPMDTIDVDTVGTICDLTRAPSGAFLTSGIWVCGGFMQMDPTGSTGPAFGKASMNLNIVAGSSEVKFGPAIAGNEQFDGSGALTSYLSSTAIIYSGPQTALTTTPTIQINWGTTITTGGSGSITISAANLWGYWVCDLP